jgi:hypothetical protein
MISVRYWIVAGILIASYASAQDVDLSLPKTDTFTEHDSLSIFSLIDSLLNLEDFNTSQLALRISYNSNVISAGRTLGINNFGLSPGISYYHRSGMYGDISGYWSNDFEPSYYLTVASAGYMRDFTKNFSVMAGYDRYFYNLVNEEDFIPYNNTLSVTPVIEFKPVSLSINYSFYFGDQKAHRIMPGLGFMLEKKKVLKKIDRICISPTYYLLWGNELLTEFEFIPPSTIREAADNYRKYGTRYRIEQHDKNVFGIMNHTIAVPLIMSLNNWSFSFTYSYNIPKALKGEPFTLSESSYLSASLSYLIALRQK